MAGLKLCPFKAKEKAAWWAAFGVLVGFLWVEV
jgi:hypothetical protein